MACVPFFLWLLLAREARGWAAVLLAVMGATDWVDGFAARRLGQVSELGKVLDPVADRLVLGSAVVALLLDGSVPRWIAAAVIARELAVAAVTVGAALGGASRIDVRWVGKAGTLCLMFALPLFLAGEASVASGAAHAFAWAFVVPGLALSNLAAVSYLPDVRAALREGRRGPAQVDLEATRNVDAIGGAI